jgi:hypothetical protein
LDVPGCLVDLVQQRNQKPPRFASAVLGPGDDALPGHDQRDGFLLDGRGHVVAVLGQGEDDIFLEPELIEIFVFGGLDVLA